MWINVNDFCEMCDYISQQNEAEGYTLLVQPFADRQVGRRRNEGQICQSKWHRLFYDFFFTMLYLNKY